MPNYDYMLHYSQWHDDSEAHCLWMAGNFRSALEAHLVDVPKDAAILDIGCSLGFALLACQQLGYKNVRGVDLDPRMVESCRKRGLDVVETADTPRYLAGMKESLDVVLLFDVLEHVPVEEQIPFLRSVAGALKSGGRAIIEVPNADSLLGCHFRYDDYTHHCLFTDNSLRFVVLNAGFARMNVVPEVYGRPPLSLWRRGSRLGFYRWLIRRLWRGALRAELGESGKVDEIRLAPRIRVVAVKEKS